MKNKKHLNRPVALTERANALLRRFHLAPESRKNGWLALLTDRRAAGLITWNQYAEEVNEYAR